MSTFRDSLGVHAYASMFGMNGSASTELSTLVSKSISDNNKYLSVRIIVDGDQDQIDGDIKMTDDGLEALKVSPAFFKQACGDSYITNVVSGGEFVAVVELRNASDAEAKSLQGELMASYGAASLDAKIASDWQKLTAEDRVHIEIAQTGYVDDHPTSLTDPAALLSFASKFEKDLTSPGAKPSTSKVLFAPYANSVAFQLALHKANEAKWHNFNSSAAIMGELIKGYDLATDRIEFVQSALNSPDDYFEFKPKIAEAYLATISDERALIADLIKACGSAASSGEDCVKVDAAASVIDPVPSDIKLLAACNVIAFGLSHHSTDSSCTQVEKHGHDCMCTECQLYLGSEYKKDSGQKLEASCVGFEPYSPVKATLHSTISVKGSGDIWPELFFNSVHFHNMSHQGVNSVEFQEDIPGTFLTDPSGNFDASLTVNQCDLNAVHTMCYFDHTKPTDMSMMTVRRLH
ncbi:hypothetical protein EB235_08205 [Mesorhizobium loti R88b]|uniref:Uncharacterized protein n=2 Tax=Rhizobium loti TaxID=381 RepID=A0A6M7WIA2_RHILI|nr:hypothetical protein EB235_08205 [Mesorhizobium loti R88b]